MDVFRLEPRKIDARQDTNDDSYLNMATLRELLTSPLLQSCQQIRTEALAVFYRHTQFVICSIPDLNVFTQQIGHPGQQLLRHIKLYDPLFSLWPEENIKLVIQALATSCPTLKTFHIHFDEEDMLFPALREDVESLPEEFRYLEVVLQNPRVAALLQLGTEVKTTFEVDISNQRRRAYEFLRGDHELLELPQWIGRFYIGNKPWSDISEVYQN
jgi:hypothetical protein